jgi:hypothetical protein
MDDSGLRRCLQDNLQPSDWYRLLNSRVFFWLSKQRLHRLLNAAAYREKEHDVLELDAAPIVEKHLNDIRLAPINTGCTKPMPHPRGLETFQTVNDYPYDYWRSRRPKWDCVTELAVVRGVPEVAPYVRRVVVMKGEEVISTLWER